MTSSDILFLLFFQLQSKRELFFKSESVSGGVSTTGPPIGAPPAPPVAPSSLKDALAKRSATLPDPHENSHHETNGTSKLSNSVSVDAPKPPTSAPPPTPAPPIPTSAPPASAPLRSTENIMKVKRKRTLPTFR